MQSPSSSAMPGKSDTSTQPSAATTTPGPEVTSKGEQGKSDLNAQGGYRSANKSSASTQGAQGSSTSGGMSNSSSSAMSGSQGSTDMNAQGSTDRSANKATRSSSGSKQAAASKSTTKASKPAHDSMAGMKGHESDRHAAVRKCALQPVQSDRDRCLDQVVAQYGS